MAMTARELVNLAEGALEQLPPGAEFELSDLFSPETWRTAPTGARRAAGTLFLRRMRNSPLVSCLGRDLTNHQRYRRLG